MTFTEGSRRAAAHSRAEKDLFFHLQNEQIKWKLLVFPLKARPPKSGLDEFECVLCIFAEILGDSL